MPELLVRQKGRGFGNYRRVWVCSFGITLEEKAIFEVEVYLRVLNHRERSREYHLYHHYSPSMSPSMSDALSAPSFASVIDGQLLASDPALIPGLRESPLPIRGTDLFLLMNAVLSVFREYEIQRRQ